MPEAIPGLAPHLLDFVAAAAYLGTTPRHVRRLWAERRLTGHKVGGRYVRFTREDLDTFIARGRVEAVR
jgi:excisionase family DNA binding protein